MWKIQPGHELLDRLTDGTTVTLTLGEGGWVICMTRRLTMESGDVHDLLSLYGE